MRHFLCVIALLLGFIAPPNASSAQNYENLFRDFRASTLSQADKRFLQAALAFEGHYNGLLDGDWGALSQKALERYSQQEFGTGAEDWHMAMLALGFFDIVRRDGWAERHFDVLEMSMLYPYRAAVSEPSTESLANWRHTNSSVSYSTGIHTVATVQRLHDYTAKIHNSSMELYEMRRRDVAITSATEADGSVLYTRSNYVNSAWSTVMLSANRRDVPILNAIAASISVGYAAPIMYSDGGKLDQVLDQALAYAENEPQTNPANRDATSTPQQTNPQKSSGTGFVVSENGHVLTNAHVVEGCTVLKFDGYNATVISDSSDFDLALLQVDGLPETGVAQFSPSPARLNSDVTVVGYPLAGILSGLNVTRGAVSSKMGLGGDVSGMQITAPVQPGNSGGPVLAADGEVIGVVVSKLNAQVIADATGDIPQNVNFAIRGEIAKLFLFQHGVEPMLGTNDDALSPVNLADLAMGFTGFIECN
jgi:serine protease Do